MANFEKELSTLKELLAASDDFSEINRYFYDKLAESPTFLQSCKKAKHPILKKGLKKIGERLFKEKVTLSHFLLLKARKYPFFHGGFSMNGRMSSVFFFKDIDMGLATICTSISESEMKFVRFSCMTVKRDSDGPLFIDPTKSTSIH